MSAGSDTGAFPEATTQALGSALEGLTEAVELAHERLPQETVAMGSLVIDRVRERIGHGTANTLVALLGATGGGKSSLTNSVVGSEVATTGLRRPTTSSTLACYWGTNDPHPLLDWLEVANRHHVSDPDNVAGLDGLVLLDVPDHDSVEVSNRTEMERIAEYADLLIWVSDPEKYADEAMHAYLRQLSHHGAVTAMVLNKADRLSAHDLSQCRADLARLLSDDGLAGTTIITTSATPGLAATEAEGVEELIELLATTVEQRQTMVARLQADLASAATALLGDLGPPGGPDKVPKKMAKNLVDELVEASGVARVGEAVEAGHRRDAALATGWPFTRWLRSLRPHPLRRLHLGPWSRGRSSRPEPSGVEKSRTAGAIRTALTELTGELPQPWPDLVRQAATPDMDELNDRLDQAIARSVRADDRTPLWWQIVNVAQGTLAAATITGLVWLALLALAAYFQLPDIPTPSYRRIPIPTGLVLAGVALGLLAAVLARWLASIGARRRRRAMNRAAATAIGDTVDELVVNLMQVELERRNRLRSLLVGAGGRDISGH
ncbi:MAG: ABC transporter [Actinomycetia bacterium]|nr:ABC transporter [Actinomycetes bacterium]